MHLDPIMPTAVGGLLLILAVGILLRRLRQPHVVGYLLAGLVLGPSGLALVEDEATLSRMGALGVVLLLFFVGMEVAPRRLLEGWRVAVGGTLLQVGLSVALVAGLGWWLDWSSGRIVLIGFVISLSSTAVVIKMLQEWREVESREGQDVIGILLVQDLVVIPMLIVIGLMSGHGFEPRESLLQLFGALLVLALVMRIVRGGTLHLPFARWLRLDHEMQVFAALGLCFGFALLTGMLGLSTALGAFVAGMLVAAARETRWIHLSLEPFRVVFLALFFVSVGMLVELEFLLDHALQVGVLLLLVLLCNTGINALILRLLGYSWRQGLYAGALLSQIGEFSFVLAAVGYQVGLISGYGYQMALAVIALSLLASPFWIRLVKGWTHEVGFGEPQGRSR